MNSSKLLTGSCLHFLLLLLVVICTVSYLVTPVFSADCVTDQNCALQLNGTRCINNKTCGCLNDMDCKGYDTTVEYGIFSAGPKCNLTTNTCSCRPGSRDCQGAQNGRGTYCQEWQPPGTCSCTTQSKWICGCNSNAQCNGESYGPECLFNVGDSPPFCGCVSDEQCVNSHWGTKCDLTTGSPTKNRCGCQGDGDCNRYSYGFFCKKAPGRTGMKDFGVCSCFKTDSSVANSTSCAKNILGTTCGTTTSSFPARCGCDSSSAAGANYSRGPSCELVPGSPSQWQYGCCSPEECVDNLNGPYCELSRVTGLFKKCSCRNSTDCVKYAVVGGPTCDEDPTSSTYRQCGCTRDSDCNKPGFGNRIKCDPIASSITYHMCIVPPNPSTFISYFTDW